MIMMRLYSYCNEHVVSTNSNPSYITGVTAPVVCCSFQAISGTYCFELLSVVSRNHCSPHVLSEALVAIERLLSFVAKLVRKFLTPFC